MIVVQNRISFLTIPVKCSSCDSLNIYSVELQLIILNGDLYQQIYNYTLELN
jgi:hypothetical protein